MKALVLAAGLAAFGSSAALAQDGAHDFGGFRIGVTSGYFGGTAFDDYNGTPGTYFPIGGFLWGINAGFDLDLNGFVIGIGAEAVWGSVSGAYANAFQEGAFALNRTVSILARAGYAVNQMLFYATGGFNFSRVTVSGGPAGGPLDTDTVTFHSGLRPGYGWSFGLGVERAFSHGISASFEYRYVNVGDEFISLAPTLQGECTSWRRGGTPSASA